MKTRKQEKFDADQGHGNHIDTISSCETTEQFICSWLQKSVQEGDLLWKTKSPINCSFGSEMPERMKFIAIGSGREPVRLNALIAVVEEGQRNTLVSAYPECDGAEVEVKLTSIHEWAAGVEATLEGTVLGEAERQIAFFDTRYALHKGTYRIGATYTFRLAAFAYNAAVVPKPEREFRMTGEAAAKRRQALGQKPEFEKDGSIKPLVFSMDQMVAFFQSSAAYPDDAEFQSPVFKPVKAVKGFDTSFYRLEIAIAREDSDIVVPLIARQSLFATKPRKGDPIRGHLWLQGRLAEDNADAVPADGQSS